MGEIVKNWLFQKTGILPNLREKDFGIIITDGSVLAKLLQSYGVLASDVAEAIKPSDDLAIKVNNLRLLQAPLNFIGIKIDNTEVEELALGTGTTALKLIYEIFLKLEGGEKFHFAGQVKENEKKISELHVSIKSDPPCPKFQKNPLVKKINEKINPVEWHKTRYEELNKRCKEAREYAREALRKIILHDDPCSLSDTSKRTEKENIEKELSDAKKSMKNFSQKYDVNGKELSFQDLIHMKETSEKYTPMIESKVKAKELLNLMRQRSKREAASQAFRQSMRALLLTRIWDHLLEQNEKVFDEAVLQKLLRQSRYEKQIATKLFQVRHEQKTIAQNRIRRNKLILDRRHTELTLDYLRKDAEMESEVYELNLENRRKLEHHRRLYEVKIRRKHEKHYSLCQEILSAFVDISIKSSEYQRHAGYEVPTALWNEWKVSFLKGLPIFEGIVNLEIMLNEKFQELPDPIIMLEVERNEALVDQEFKDYMALSGLWSLDNLNHELNRFEENLEILGFVIHTLLSAKYPKPVPKKPAVLPTAKVAAVVVDIADDRTTNALQKLLNNRGIVVVRLNNVLAESIGTYHREILNRRDFEVEMTSDLNIALNDSTRIYTVNGNKENSTEFQSVRQEVNGTTDEDEVHVTFKDKVTQTPRRVPCDDETSYPSKMAELGKHIYEILLQGQHIPDSLLIDSVIEYLRENTTEDGWLLVNFPNTYQQADLFEESLTGQRLPPLSHQTQTTEEFIVNVGNRESPEEHICLAQSSLLPNPIPEPREEPFRTYFTVYVNMKKTEEDSEEFQIAFSSESTPLEKFYWNQGINYSFYYKTFNFDIVKYLAKVVIGDSEIRLKTSEELFGPVLEEVANQLNPPKTQENTSKRTRREDSNKTENQSAKKTRSVQIPNTEEKHPNVQKKQSRVKENGNTTTKNGELEPDKDKKRKRDDKKDTVNNDKSSNKRNGGINTTDDIQVKDIETLNHREVLTQALKPEQTEHPEKTHRFVELDIPAEFQVILATVWEAVEKVYIETLKQVFFLMRLHRSTIVPYEKCVRDSFSEIIKRPSEKQQAVSDFQSKFNDISGELREFTDMKNELHCRVQELESLLLDMCDERKKGVEAERRRVAGQSWVAGEMAALADVFAAAARAEAERAVSTLQLLADYYLAGLRRAPLSPRLRGEGAPPAHTTTGERRRSRSGHSDAAAAAAVTRWLVEVSAAPVEPPLHPNSAFAAADAAAATLHDVAATLHDVVARERRDVANKMGTDKKKKPKKKAKQQASEDMEDEATAAFLQLSSRIFEEWEEAIACEVNRATFRLNLLRSKARKDLAEFLTGMRKLFQDIHEEIAQRYEREVSAVEALCEVLRAAIEEETPVQQQLVLEQDRFVARRDVLLFPSPPPPAAPLPDEPTTSTAFRVDQLQWLAKTFRMMSPNGVMPERALVFVLEDLLAHGTEGDMPRLLPSRWENLGQGHVDVLVAKLYGAVAYVDWRDFLVHALALPAPSQVQLLNCRHRLRALDIHRHEVVAWEHFCQVRFWFEEDFPTESPELQIRLKRIKELLFSMFEIRANLTSYTDMLLAFCKDEDPKEGLAKALALAMGKIIRVRKPVDESEDEMLPLHREDSDPVVHSLEDGSDEIKVHSLEDGSDEAKVRSLEDGSDKAKVRSLEDGSDEAKVHSLEDGSDEVKVHSLEDGSDEAKVHSLEDGSDEAKVRSLEDGSDEAKVHSLEDGSDEAKVRSLEDGSDEAKVHSLEDGSDEAKVHSLEDGSDETKVHSLEDGSDEAKVRSPEDSSDEAKVHSLEDGSDEVKVHSLEDGSDEAKVHSLEDGSDKAKVAVENVMTAILEEGIPSESEMAREGSGNVAVRDAVHNLLIRAVPSEYEFAEALPLDLVAAVLAASLLWGAEIPPLFGSGRTTLWEGLTEVYRNLEAVDDCVQTWDFFLHGFVSELLALVPKFKAVDLESVLEEVLATCVDKAENDVSKSFVRLTHGS